MSNTYNANEQTDRGHQIFLYFHNEALKYPENYSMRIDGVEHLLLNKNPNFFQILGKYAMGAGLTENQLREKMEQLADINKGLLPNQLSQFLKIIDDPEPHEWSSWDTFKAVTAALPDAVVETASQVGDYAQNVTSAAGGSIISILKYAPLLLGGAVLLFVFVKAKSPI